MNGSTPIIIKRRKKGDHGDVVHSGSWKVAYADFVTAMMAFFLLLWLLAMVSPEKKVALSDYFQNYNIFKEQTTSGGKTILPAQTGVMSAKPMGAKPSGEPITVIAPKKERITATAMAERVKDAVQRNLRYLKDQILIDVVEGGVRIQIIDLEGSMMFPLGSDVPTEKASRILELVAENIRDTDNKIAIEGHTDAKPFAAGKTTNWELSTARASAARRTLEKNGIEPDRIARVVGYADQEPLIKENPYDPRNRRISIILLNQSPSTVSAPENVPPAEQVHTEKVTSHPPPAPRKN